MLETIEKGAMNLWRPLTPTGSVGIKLVAKPKESTIESEYLLSVSGS